MANHWAIIIGINQYRSLQPLLFAQNDAVELHNFFVKDAGWSLDRCRLITDTAAGPESSTYPSREAINAQIQEVCRQLDPSDTLWFFFSGYGLTWQGQDYLLPADVDLDQIESTGIAVQTLLKELKAAPTQKIIVALDINRSLSALPNQRLGVQSEELAKSLAISLLLSCQPEQFSHESLGIRHGFFTAALLEGMRFHGCLTLSQLATYVNDRVPELCEHHMRPPQTPRAVLPAEGEFLLVIPPEAIVQLPLTQAAAESTEMTVQSLRQESSELPAGASNLGATPTSQSEAGKAEESVFSLPANGDAANQEDEEDEEAEPSGWQRWALLVAGVLLLGVFIRNQAIFTGRDGDQPAPTAEVESVEGDEGQGDSAPAAEPGDSLFPEGTNDGTIPLVPLDQAQAALEAGRYSEALTWLEQVPEAQQNETYQSLLEQAQVGAAEAGQSSQQSLAEAQESLRSVTVAPLAEAIAQAQQVPMGNPYYQQAQGSIQRWGQVILDVAEARAATGDFDAAIAAARQVPEGPPELYNLAQERIALYQQRKINQDVLKQAQERLVPNQASTFRDSINLVAPISAEYPEYAIAQERIQRWSEDILAIARTRAAQGELQDAIAAAMLVPEQTPTYEQAQEQIQQWQAQLEIAQ